MKDLTTLGINIHPAIYVPVLYFLWVSVLFILKKIVFSRIRAFAVRTSTKLDDIVLHALDLPLLLLIFASGIFLLDNIFQFGTDSELLAFVDIAFKAVTIIAIIMLVNRLFMGIIELYSEKVQILKDSKGVVHVIIRVVVIGLGLLILLDSFGVSITPILASLGVGSLAIALALQPTMENFFAGIQIVIDKPFAIGHFIQLESGEEGYVEKIGWRSTWVKQLPNNVVVIPNKVLVGARVLNYYYPQKEMAILIQLGVHYDSDLEHVEKVTLDVAREIVSEVEGGVPGFDPFMRYHTFNDSSIDFKVVLRVKEFVDGYLVKHEFIKRLKKRYDKEGIVIPFPIRTLDWNPGSDSIKMAKE
ncbi:MAG: mechanosensitive ion channel [Candidatus Omnitrophica bacterium]|nr:mechanosensitive ion channel [Candidatus Omnitrophota bacterium]